MVSIEGFERLLKAIEEAPDNSSALLAVCAWLRTTTPVASVAMVSADGGTFLGGLGWKPSDLSGRIGTILTGPHAEMGSGDVGEGCRGFAVPIRYGGATVGRLVVGLNGGAATIAVPATRAAAMLCGPAARACLDDIELRQRDRDGLQDVIGQSEAIAAVRSAIARAAATPFPVLIEGESGTGKELAARALHRLSARRERRFLAVNCAAFTDELVEAELFGHTKGAFTGAAGPRAGLFEDAHGGTLFLDEVAELSPRAQAKLLRVLQEREVRRVGESAARPVDVRVVCATNTPLAEAVARGRFRDDLRFRLAVVSVRLPALRERIEDSPALAHTFWRRALLDTGKRAYLGADALARLTRHQWPGNVRELQNVVAGLAVAAPATGRVTARHVSLVLGEFSGTASDAAANVQSLETARRMFERRVVAQTMARHAGKRTAAALELGLTRQGLAKTLRRLGLTGDDATADVA
jgi:transcriptional regulator with PAS, ATPase and Fis domain